MKPKLQILVDNQDSWIAPLAETLAHELAHDFETSYLNRHDEIQPGDILILLGCEKILKASHRALNKINLVVHESPLPLGRGWSPLTWQVLAGAKRITVCLLEAHERVDAGLIFETTEIELEGHELVEELRAKQAEASADLLRKFLKKYPNNKGVPQVGTPSYYPRRTPKDSELDPEQSLAQQFNLLRVADNDRYPLFFQLNSHRYIIKISKDDR